MAVPQKKMVIKATTTDMLRELGFKNAPTELAVKRAVISIAARQDCGKTNLSLTGHAPVIYFDIDTGSEGVAEDFAATGKEILTYRLRVDKSAGEKGLWDGQWIDFKEKLVAAWGLESGTVVVDTMTEAYDLARLARFGKLTQVMPHNYTETNAEMRELVRLAFESKMTTIFIHKMKPLYINEKRTGEYEPAGWGDMEYEAQVTLRPYSVLDEEGKKVFRVTINKCRLKAQLSGMDIPCGKAGDPPGTTIQYLLDLLYSKPKKKKTKAVDANEDELPKKKAVVEDEDEEDEMPPAPE